MARGCGTNFVLACFFFSAQNGEGWIFDDDRRPRLAKHRGPLALFLAYAKIVSMSDR